MNNTSRLAAILFSVILLVISLFTPWIAHKAAGLNLTGIEFGDWLKYAPTHPVGQSPLLRSLFLAPSLLASLTLALTPQPVAKTSPRKWIWTILALLVGLILLPSYQDLVERNWTTIVIRLGGFLVSAVLAMLVPLRIKIGSKVSAVLRITASTACLTAVTIVFQRSEPFVEMLYASQIDPGFGFHSARLGSLILLLLAIVGLINNRKDDVK
ncbi:MAG: hypothetical protein ABFQ89_04170 [Chloroflexota bacterium]